MSCALDVCFFSFYNLIFFYWRQLFRDFLTISTKTKTYPSVAVNSKSIHAFSMYILRSHYCKGSEWAFLFFKLEQNAQFLTISAIACHELCLRGCNLSVTDSHPVLAALVLWQEANRFAKTLQEANSAFNVGEEPAQQNEARDFPDLQHDTQTTVRIQPAETGAAYGAHLVMPFSTLWGHLLARSVSYLQGSIWSVAFLCAQHPLQVFF